MLINHPTMSPHVFFVMFNSNHQAALRNDALFIMERRPYELYEIVQLWSGDGVALPLTLSLTVGVVGLTLRGVRLLGRIFIKKKNIIFFFIWPKNLLSGLFAKR